MEFVARYRTGGRAQRLHEVSRFVRETLGDPAREGAADAGKTDQSAARWYYVDGSFPDKT